MPPRALPGFPCNFQPPGTCNQHELEGDIKEQKFSKFLRAPLDKLTTPQKWLGLPGRDLLYPKYAIHNRAARSDEANAAEGGLSNKTVNTDVKHQNGLVMYDTHNLYGSSKSSKVSA